MAQQKNELVKVSEEEKKELVGVYEKFSGLALKEMNAVEKALVLSEATIALRNAFTPTIMKQIMALMDLPYGFKTDRAPGTKERENKGSYTENDVKDVMVSAVLYGLYPTGNEINIIAKNMYVTKEGFTRKLRDIQGITDLSISYGIPKTSSNGLGAVVSCFAKWKLNGIIQSIGINKDDKCDIPVRVNDRMGIDAIIGKAERKLKKKIYDRITGSEHTIPDGDISDLTEINAKIIDQGKIDISDLSESEEQHKPVDAPIFDEVENKKECPESYMRLYEAYDTHEKLIDKCLKEVGLKYLNQIVWQDLNEEDLQKLKRASAKFAKAISEE